jgi:speckle-type POZ protein
MFEVDMVEKKENVLNITDIDFDVMQEIVRYIYTDQVEHIEDLAPSLLLAADKVKMLMLTNSPNNLHYNFSTICNL